MNRLINNKRNSALRIRDRIRNVYFKLLFLFYYVRHMGTYVYCNRGVNRGEKYVYK